MKFVIGFLGGLVVGAVGAVAYSVQTGKDLREIVDEVRSDLSKRDLDALGARLETRVSEMQKELESRIAAVKEKASAAVDEASPAIHSGIAADAAGDTADAAVADATDAAETESVVEAVGDEVADARDAIEGQAQG